MQQSTARNKIFNRRSEVNYGNYKPSAEALICLSCPLPSKNCKLDKCERYNSEMNKLRRKTIEKSRTTK